MAEAPYVVLIDLELSLGTLVMLNPHLIIVAKSKREVWHSEDFV